MSKAELIEQKRSSSLDISREEIDQISLEVSKLVA